MKFKLITACTLSTISAIAQIPAQPVVIEEVVEIQRQAPPVLTEEVVEVQPAIPPVREVVVEEVITEGTPVIRRIDPELARRQLSMVPRALPVAPAPAPGTVVETTETTTTVDLPGLPPRVYNTERSVVIVEGRELPYVTLPVLFVKETAELLDSESRIALEDTAGFIREILQREPGAMFQIEGHTSTDGETGFNMDLSKQRAIRIHEELTKRYSVPASSLTASGYGESFPAYPNGSEAQMIQDRRVLVVRVK